MSAALTPEELLDHWKERARQTHPGAMAEQAVDTLVASGGLPDRRREGWRWSDLRAAISRIGDAGALPFDPFAQAHGVAMQPRADKPDALRISTDPAFASYPWRADIAPLAGAFTALAADRRARIEIAADPGVPLRLCTCDGNDAFDHTDIVVAPGVRARLIETRLSGGGFYGNAMTIHVGEDAHLERVIYRGGPAEAVQVTIEDIRLESRAQVTQTLLTPGAGYARTDTTVVVLGEDAHVRMDALYVLGDKHHGDLTTHVDHRAAGCTTRQTTRGVVGAGGRGVFQGKFHVARAAQKTDARMHHGAVLLDPDAWAFARPELEIYADDVACAHGNAIGALDPGALSYARQRGLSEKQARALLARGFVGEALDALAPDDPLHSALDEATDAWIARCC